MSTAPPRVALETTLLLHGVPRLQAVPLYRELVRVVQDAGSIPALVGVVAGRGVIGMTEAAFLSMLEARQAGREPPHQEGLIAVPKLNTANLGVTMALGADGATTVSTTMELAAAAGIRIFATGGLGGVHRGYDRALDISTDLAAFTRFPLAVVCSGVKSILDVSSTREVLETLGVPVIGYQTSSFPAFYLRDADPPIAVDARFDDVDALARYVRRELARTGRGIVIVNPIDAQHQLARAHWDGWLAQATKDAEHAGVSGRGVTPFVLGRLHHISGGATLRANVELVKSNAGLAGRVAAAMARRAEASSMV
ncbi:MAG: pseudouridine-5'-phosphate glycosidase [Pyrinomonadaceae bacterium]|nr:pseudouridine-5'-phosphate glycosidase [Phycisphaerales bacterium]